MSAPQCDGEIRRYGTAVRCGNDATWIVRINERVATANACGHHIGQVLDDLRKAKGDDIRLIVCHH